MAGGETEAWLGDAPVGSVVVGFRPGSAGPEPFGDNGLSLWVAGQPLLLPIGGADQPPEPRPLVDSISVTGVVDRPDLHWERTLLFAPPDLLVIVDHLASDRPRQLGWAVALACRPGLNLHARRIDLTSGAVTASLYLLLPHAVAARAIEDRLEVVTTQQTTEARLVTLIVLHPSGSLPIPTRKEQDGLLCFTWPRAENPRRVVVELEPSSRPGVRIESAPVQRSLGQSSKNTTS